MFTKDDKRGIGKAGTQFTLSTIIDKSAQLDEKRTKAPSSVKMS